MYAYVAKEVSLYNKLAKTTDIQQKSFSRPHTGAPPENHRRTPLLLRILIPRHQQKCLHL